MATETDEDKLRTVNVVKLEGLSYYIEDTSAREDLVKAQSAIDTNTEDISDIKTKVDTIAKGEPGENGTEKNIKVNVPVRWTSWANKDWIGSYALRTVVTGEQEQSIAIVDENGNLVPTTADKAGYLALTYNKALIIASDKLAPDNN